jgi:hypothetical protein
MANYLKGIGDAATRVNEILPSFDARINRFLIGYPAGIIQGEYNEFHATPIDRSVIVKSGMLQACGYFGCSDTDTQINFVMPSTTQYIHLYAEIDLSVVPNRFEIKATPMTNNAAWTPRHDDLIGIPNGRYQFHLWQVTLTASTIILTDRRTFINKPLNAVNADNYSAGGGIAVKFGQVDVALSARAPIHSPIFTGTPTINISTRPTTQTEVINRTGNGQTAVFHVGEIEAGWYRVVLAGAGGGNGGRNNNGDGGRGGTGGHLDIAVWIPFRVSYIIAAGGAGATAAAQTNNVGAGGGGGAASIFLVPQLGIALTAMGGAGGGGRPWASYNPGRGGDGGGYSSGRVGFNSDGGNGGARIGAAAGAGYPARLASDNLAQGGGSIGNGENGGNSINANTGGGSAAGTNGTARLFRLS